MMRCNHIDYILAITRLDEIKTSPDAIVDLKNKAGALQQQTYPYFLIMLKACLN